MSSGENEKNADWPNLGWNDEMSVAWLKAMCTLGFARDVNTAFGENADLPPFFLRRCARTSGGERIVLANGHIHSKDPEHPD